MEILFRLCIIKFMDLLVFFQNFEDTGKKNDLTVESQRHVLQLDSL